jgi:hypothetical protein
MLEYYGKCNLFCSYASALLMKQEYLSPERDKNISGNQTGQELSRILLN